MDRLAEELERAWFGKTAGLATPLSSFFEQLETGVIGQVKSAGQDLKSGLEKWIKMLDKALRPLGFQVSARRMPVIKGMIISQPYDLVHINCKMLFEATDGRKLTPEDVKKLVAATGLPAGSGSSWSLISPQLIQWDRWEDS